MTQVSRPKAWSFSALEGFENCPKQYYETQVEKRFPFVESKEMRWGKEVHKHFENFLVHGSPLPATLATHAEYLQWIKSKPGQLVGEEKLALDFNLQPCSYFGKSVWYRGQVDARVRNGSSVFLVDHKTGKVKNDFTQLKTFTIYEFLTNPQAQHVRAEYYWTQIAAPKGEDYTRDQLPQMLLELAPRLDRFADAFLTGVFPPKQSGLCRGHCVVSDCEFWTPKKVAS